MTKSFILRTCIGIFAILAICGGFLANRILSHPSLARYKDFEPRPPVQPGALQAKFLGTASIAFSDGRTTILTDAFLSRPRLADVLFGKLRPDPKAIAFALNQGGIIQVKAIMVAHSHFDHALDSAAVAEMTGATVYGSQSTVNVARGFGLPPARMKQIKDGDRFTFGEFEVQVFQTPHSPDAKFPGEIAKPLQFPAKVGAFRGGANFSFLVTHGTTRTLIVPSANFTAGKFRGVKADTVFLAIGSLGKQTPSFADNYWQEIVETTGAKRVIPIHWDDFTLPLNEPLQPLGPAYDDFNTGMDMVLTRARRDHVRVELPRPFQVIDLAKY